MTNYTDITMMIGIIGGMTVIGIIINNNTRKEGDIANYILGGSGGFLLGIGIYSALIQLFDILNH